MTILPNDDNGKVSSFEETEQGRRPSGVSSNVAPAAGSRYNPPDPEVSSKPARRKFTAEYKLKILAEADNCTRQGDIGALLRREGLFTSHLTQWRRKRREGSLGALSEAKRGPKPEKNPLASEVARLEREVERLKRKLDQAETIIDVQKKVSGLLGIDFASPEKDGKS
jgi:transposase